MVSWSWHVRISHVQRRSKTMPNLFSDQLLDHQTNQFKKGINTISLHFYSVYNIHSHCSIIISLFPHQKHLWNLLENQETFWHNFVTWKNHLLKTCSRSFNAFQIISIHYNILSQVSQTSFQSFLALDSKLATKPPFSSNQFSN